MKTMILVGDWWWKSFQEACAEAITSFGWEVIPLKWSERIFDSDANHDPIHKSAFHKFQNRYLIGPLVWKYNKELIDLVRRYKPEVLWLNHELRIWPRTLRKCKHISPSTRLVQYTLDNPWWNLRASFWKYFVASIPLFDFTFATRPDNIEQFKRAGARSVHLLRQYYVSADAYPISSEEIPPEFRSDIVFIGHYEPDGRGASLERLLQENIDVKLFGTNWNSFFDSQPEQSPFKRLPKPRPLRGFEYTQAICGTKIAISFFSKINNDTCTIRTFEIPATRTFMLSEYTEDAAALYTEGVEAEYFRNQDELVEKAKYYLSHDEERNQIAQKGYERTLHDGHDVVSRMRYLLTTIGFPPD